MLFRARFFPEDFGGKDVKEDVSSVTTGNGSRLSSCVVVSTVSASSLNGILMVAGFESDFVTDVNGGADFTTSLKFFDLDAEDCDTDGAIDPGRGGRP